MNREPPRRGMPFELDTQRLELRGWSADDLAPLAALCADAEVMRYFPAAMSLAESESLLVRLQDRFAERGYDFWAVRERGKPALLGFVGLTQVPPGMPIDAPVEVGWRLARSAWGRGIATEAAGASLDFAFERLGLEQIVAYTAAINEPSRAVMRRLGMTRDPADDFLHPALAPEDRLQPHVVYRIGRSRWRERPKA
jgi:RimJ/RimL family protein N-acetyltransferase